MAKSLRNRYSKNLFGTNHQGYHSAEQVYATAGTIAAFALTGLEGQIGIYLADNSLKPDALVAGDQFKIAQIRDGELRSSTLMTYGSGNLEVTSTPYDAAVKQINHVGYNGTSGSLALTGYAIGDEFVVSVRDTTPGTQPFPVTEGRKVINTLNGVTEYSIVFDLIKDLENLNDYERNADNGFVVSDIVNNATQVAIGTVTLAITQGSTLATYSAVHNLTAGSFVSILGIMYEIISAPTITTLILDRPYTGATQTALVTGATKATQQGSVVFVDGTTELGIRFTSITEDTNFVTGVSEDLQGATLTATTAWKQGSGEDWQVSAIEDESLVYDGFTTGNYPFVEDYGKPTKFVNEGSGINYDLWFLKYKKVTDSMAFPHEQAHHIGLVVISAPDGTAGDSPTGTLTTVLGA